jgi:hypothetical protein
MQWMRPSNEANHLIGVLGLSDSLSRAQQLLLHPFLQKLFGELGGAPNLADADVKQTVNTLIKRARGKPVFDITSEPERQALASMIVKAAQSIKAPRMFISLDDLRRRWNEYRIAYYAEHPSSANVQEDLREQWDRHEMHAVDNVLGEMRSQRMMFQGYPWKCDACQHRNWADFHALGSFLKCDVCAAETELPVDIPWHFQANEFLIESLRSHSVLSLLWVLSALSGRARTSFFYLEPTCFGFERSREKCDAEADLLALVDGQTFFCEIKSSWRSLRANDLITFVKLAKRLRPNKAMLAVMESGHGFEAEIDATRLELEDAQITFELLTPDKHSVDASPGALY